MEILRPKIQYEIVDHVHDLFYLFNERIAETLEISRGNLGLIIKE